jgi:hypothetical protein
MAGILSGFWVTFASIEGEAKSCLSFGFEASVHCTAPASVWSAGPAVSAEALVPIERRSKSLDVQSVSARSQGATTPSWRRSAWGSGLGDFAPSDGAKPMRCPATGVTQPSSHCATARAASSRRRIFGLWMRSTRDPSGRGRAERRDCSPVDGIAARRRAQWPGWFVALWKSLDLLRSVPALAV